MIRSLSCSSPNILLNLHLPLGSAGRQASGCAWYSSARLHREGRQLHFSLLYHVLLFELVTSAQGRNHSQGWKIKVKEKIHDSVHVHGSIRVSPFFLCCLIHFVEMHVSRTTGNRSRG